MSMSAKKFMTSTAVPDHRIGDIPNVEKPKPKSGPKSRSGKLKAERRRQKIPPAAYSIPTFCVAHGISESFYYAFRKDGLGPTEMRVGDRILISAEAAARWRAEREAATQNDDAA
jgi:hypothetical protein